MKKPLIRAVAAGLVVMQLAGCLQTAQIRQSVQDTVYGSGESVSSPNYHKGEMKPSQAAQAETAASMFMAIDSGVVGYSQPEYKRRLSAFHQARDSYMAAGDKVTQDQFVDLSSSLRDVMIYADMVEAGSPAVRSAQPRSPQASEVYSIPPGAVAEFDFNGFCVKSSFDKASPGEAMQLLSDDQMWGSKLPQYRRLMASAPAQAPGGHNLYPGGLPDQQVAVWALRGLEDGTMSPNVANSLSSRQKQLLIDAGVSPSELQLAMAKGQAFGQLESLATSAIGDALGGVMRQTAPGMRDTSRQVLGAARAAGLSPDQMLVNPAVLSSPAALSRELQDWAAADERSVAPPARGDLDQYSMIGPGVAAKTLSTGKLSGVVSIANLSGKPFSFMPDRYIANARSATTQPASLARTGLTGQDGAYKVVQSPGDGAAFASLKNDLAGLAESSLLKSLGHNETLLSAAKGIFKSKALQALVGSLPVVGNVLSLGTLIAGVNLDGTPMDSTDYAAAAIGMIPVVGNLGRMGLLGGKATAGFVRALNSKGVDIAGSAVETALEFSQTESGQEVPGWMEDQFQEMTQRVADFSGARA